MFNKLKTKINIEKLVIWAIVVTAIFFLNRYSKYQSSIHLPIFENIRYGNFLFQKWFLVVIAFAVFIYTLIREGKLNLTKLIKNYALPVIFLSLAILLARFISFNFWFYCDDYGIVGYHFYNTSLQGTSCCTPGYYSLGLMYLVVRWFGHVYEAYKAVGLFIHVLAGIAVYTLANLIQKNKSVSLLAALFLVTTPTNYYQTVSALEFMGDSFSLLLFILSIYTLIAGYWSSSVIFTAAAFEFGLSRTHFISLPLFLIMLLFIPKDKRRKTEWFLTGLAFLIIPLTFLHVFGHITGPSGNALTWNPIFVYASVLLGVTTPQTIIYPFIKWLRLLTDNSLYIVPLLGIIILVILTIFVIWNIYKKKTAAKTSFLGLTILLASIVVPVLRGSRITSDFPGLTGQYLSSIPSSNTGYGLFPAFGLALLIISLGQMIRPKLFTVMLSSVVVFNIFSYINLDSHFADLYAVHERAINKQVDKILPNDGLAKIIFIPDRSKTYIDLMRFREIYRAKETIIITSEPKTFMEAYNKYKPTKDHLYYFVLNENTYQIHDWSDKLRALPSSRLETGLKTLNDNPDLKYFWAR